VKNTDAAVAALLVQKQQAIQQTDQYQWFVGPNGGGNEELWEQYSGDASTGTFSGITNAFKFTMEKWSYNLRNMFKEWLSTLLQILFQAAALCINTIRTFNLIVLAILGPLVFGISVFDGFHHTLTNWIARYLNVFLWLPVANIFGAIIGNIQVQMLQLDLAQIQARGDTYFSTMDAGYLIFMIIGIVGYFTVPTVAGHIVQIGDHGAHLKKVTNISTNTSSTAMGAAGGAAGGAMGAAGRALGNLASSPWDTAAGYREGGQSGTMWGRAGQTVGRASQYMRNKLKGN
jgi:conjugative transposon TraJ protein